MSRIRVLVVDDSVVVRRLVTDALSSDPAIEVVGVAANGQIALSKVEQLAPDIVTMDIEMPELDGIGAVRALRRAGHRMPIIMFSTLTERGAVATLDALAAGATDYVTKPANVGSVQQSLAQVAGELIPRMKAFVPHAAGRPSVPSPGAPPAGRTPARAAAPAAPRQVTLRPRPSGGGRPRAVIIGSSTGGPEALSKVLSGLTAPLPVPVVVVQHMPPVFTRQLAARLDRLGPSRVIEVAGGEEIVPGTVYIAQGDYHLELQRSASGARIHLQQQPPVNFCRPAVDVMFRSAVDVFGGELLAVVLTGMGADGRTGCERVVAAGGTVLVQDEPSSVVWGMPGSVATAGFAHAVLPIAEVAPAIARAVTTADLTATGGGR